MTSGLAPQNPATLLGSALIKQWTNLFFDLLGVDIVIFDTPPVLVVSDAVLLAKQLDAEVVMVVAANRTRRNAALRAKERYTDTGHEIAGVVLNGVKPSDLDYYGYQGYYYYYSDETNKNALQPKHEGKPDSNFGVS